MPAAASRHAPERDRVAVTAQNVATSPALTERYAERRTQTAGERRAGRKLSDFPKPAWVRFRIVAGAKLPQAADMSTHSAIGTAELILAFVAIRLAAIVVVCLFALTYVARPRQAEVICSPLESGPIQAPARQGPIDEAILDMLRHD